MNIYVTKPKSLDQQVCWSFTMPDGNIFVNVHCTGNPTAVYIDKLCEQLYPNAITTHNQLEIDKYYYCKDKSSNAVTIQQCKFDAIKGWKYLGYYCNQWWVTEDNLSVFNKWEISGPVPMINCDKGV